jgi:hypothetical protein
MVLKLPICRLSPERKAYVFLVRGSLQVNGQQLRRVTRPCCKPNRLGPEPRPKRRSAGVRPDPLNMNFSLIRHSRAAGIHPHLSD